MEAPRGTYTGDQASGKLFKGRAPKGIRDNQDTRWGRKSKGTEIKKEISVFSNRRRVVRKKGKLIKSDRKRG